MAVSNNLNYDLLLDFVSYFSSPLFNAHLFMLNTSLYVENGDLFLHLHIYVYIYIYNSRDV